MHYEGEGGGPRSQIANFRGGHHPGREGDKKTKEKDTISALIQPGKPALSQGYGREV